MTCPDDMELLRWIIELEWFDVFAMTIQNKPTILLDTVFSTINGAVAMRGKAHVLPDDCEALSLEIYLHNPTNWWTKGEGPNFLLERNLKHEWQGSPNKVMLALLGTPDFSRPLVSQTEYPNELVSSITVVPSR